MRAPLVYTYIEGGSRIEFTTVPLYVNKLQFKIVGLTKLGKTRIMIGLVCGVLKVMSYITSYVHNMFRTLIYPSSGACDYSVELPHWSYCSWFDVCWSFGVVGLG